MASSCSSLCSSLYKSPYSCLLQLLSCINLCKLKIIKLDSRIRITSQKIEVLYYQNLCIPWLTLRYSEKMEQTQYQSNYENFNCGFQAGSHIVQSHYIKDHEDDPLAFPEITVSFNHEWILLPLEPLEEPEEEIFSDHELEVLSYIDDCTLKEQVVPCSPLNNSHFYSEEDLTISGGEDNEEHNENNGLGELPLSQENLNGFDSHPP